MCYTTELYDNQDSESTNIYTLYIYKTLHVKMQCIESLSHTHTHMHDKRILLFHGCINSMICFEINRDGQITLENEFVKKKTYVELVMANSAFNQQRKEACNEDQNPHPRIHFHLHCVCVCLSELSLIVVLNCVVMSLCKKCFVETIYS